MNGDEPPLKDSLAVNRAQFYYRELFWKYLVNKWDTVKGVKVRLQECVLHSYFELFEVDEVSRYSLFTVSH
jgi:hypothetical protein